MLLRKLSDALQSLSKGDKATLLGWGSKEDDMEEKYSPLQVASRVWGKFWAFPEHNPSRIEDYSVYIQIKQSGNEFYMIRVTKSGFLWKGFKSGTSWRLIQDEEELFKNKDILGAVHVRFRELPIMINDKELEPFPNYNFFWNYISK